uniref:Ig-like domain-containing protein n=1 Tax=Oryctolagus cuniculus TaxID=9986 RepID=A0A5F9DKG9_RABIT
RAPTVVLACKGTGSWDPASGFLPGTLPRPSLWAEPGSVIALGRPGALWCGGPWRPRSAICIGRESQSPGTERCPWSPETRPIPHTLMAEVYAGRYCCVCLSAAGWSEPSAALELGQVGARGAPSRSAQPSLVVASGGNVSLSCRSEYDDARTAHLLKEGGAGPLHSLEARFSHGAGVWQATFLLGPVDGTQGGIYRCYCAHSSQPHVWSLPSDGEHLHTLKPSLQAQQGPRCPGGVMVALRCGSEEAMDTFLLHKVGSGAPPQHLHVPGSAMAAQATFTLGPVTSAHGATYRCYGTPSTDPYLWSWRSDPLNVRHAHPVVQPGPTVTSGENVTFYCRLEKVTNTFFLLQEGGPSHAQGSHGAVPAEFPVGPVTSAHTGTYRCFGTYSAHVWSFPSEPVKLLVTGEEAPSSQVLPGLLKKPQGPVEGTSTPGGQGRRMGGEQRKPPAPTCPLHLHLQMWETPLLPGAWGSCPRGEAAGTPVRHGVETWTAAGCGGAGLRKERLGRRKPKPTLPSHSRFSGTPSQNHSVQSPGR